MTAHTKSGIVLRAENRSQGAVFVMAATDPSAVFFCAHDSHDKCITTPVNAYGVSSPKKLKTWPDPHSSPDQLADQLLGRIMLTNSRDDLFLLVPDINLQEQ